MKSNQCLVALTLGLGLALGLLWLMGSQNGVALADPGILYVAPGGDCGGVTPCYATVQAAVDAASAGDEIRVAEGTYTGVQNVPSLNTGTFTATQVVVITKTITIRGGYTTSDWDTPDPAAHPTTLDAQGQGRVLCLTGSISPTVEGLRMTGGNAGGLGGTSWGSDAGGGVYVYEAPATIKNCVVYSNMASTANRGSGGGLFLYGSDATLNGNTVQSNMASTANRGWGGGLSLYRSDATLSSNKVVSNMASTADWGYGGGLYLSSSDATLSGNMVRDNTAGTGDRGYGGGLSLSFSDATLSGNTVRGNTAGTAWYGFGGGLYLSHSDATLSGNTVVSNTASTALTGRGGGLFVSNTSHFTLTNNLVADNHANILGSGLWVEGYSAYPTSGRLLHTTIADNGGSGQGVFVREYTTLVFTNTIIAGHHSVGITVTTGSTATLEATLWYNNGSDTGGGGSISTGTINVYDDPAFVNPPAWDYHLTADSAAIDQGVDAGVTTDIDGDTRPWGTGYDIGADEFRQWYIYLPLALRRW